MGVKVTCCDVRYKAIWFVKIIKTRSINSFLNALEDVSKLLILSSLYNNSISYLLSLNDKCAKFQVEY